MKRMMSLFITAGVLLLMMPTAKAVGTSASSAILMEWESGRVLYEQNAHEPREIASITKLMTALVAMESGHDLQEMVTIEPEWTGVEGSSIYLKPGEKATLETLLYGMMLRSGNDAALAVAGYCGETVENFVMQMNRRAEKLGMENSSFSNPHGLNAENHYSTAYDMALLAGACLENDKLAHVVATKSITLGTRTFTNHNKLLWRFDGCIGMKTGFTEKAGRTLVSAARRDGMTLICVTLNDPNDWKDHAALFEYGFSAYQMVRVGGESAVGRIPVKDSLLPFCILEIEEEKGLCVEKSEEIERTIHLDSGAISAPVSAGQVVGQVIYRSGVRELCRMPLVAAENIKKDASEKSGGWKSLFF